MEAELVRNTDAEILLIVTKETRIFLQMVTDLDTEILISKESIEQELLRWVRSKEKVQFITTIILLLVDSV